MNNVYSGITLAIPHSSGKSQQQDCAWANDPAVLKERDRLTDWYAKDLFACSVKDVRKAVTQVSVLDCDVERPEGDPDRLCGHCRIDGKKPTAEEQNKNLIAWYGYRFMVMNEAAFMGERPLIIDCQAFPSDLAPNVDVCIGYNEDATRPADETLAFLAETFAKAGYRTTFGNRFGGPIVLDGYVGESLKITVNKRCYLNGMTLTKNRGYNKLKLTLVNVYRQLLGRAPVAISDIDHRMLLDVAREELPMTCATSPMSKWSSAIEKAPPDVLDYYALVFAYDGIEEFLREYDLEDLAYDLRGELKERVLAKMDKTAWEYLLMHAPSLEELGITWQVLAKYPNHKTDKVSFMGSPSGKIACSPVRRARSETEDLLGPLDLER